jgi:hypothetical protein
MTKAEYEAYLASPEWALKREAVRERSQNTCERCHIRPHEETHHITYVRVGHEDLTDLLGVCCECHDWLHGRDNRTSLPLNSSHIALTAYREDEPRRLDRLSRVVTRLQSRGLHTNITRLHDIKGELHVFYAQPLSDAHQNFIKREWEKEHECVVHFCKWDAEL